MRNKILPTLLLCAVMLAPFAFVKADDGVIITGNGVAPTPTPCASVCPETAQSAYSPAGSAVTAAVLLSAQSVASLVP
ncbi:MAG: hypothetical protein M3348_06535 [Acidobacteriota bacterium]|nr:hypothetical protein [Acidobacteriota bacterium]